MTDKKASFPITLSEQERTAIMYGNPDTAAATALSEQKPYTKIVNPNTQAQRIEELANNVQV